MIVPQATRLLNFNFVLYLLGLGGTSLADALLFIALPFAVLGGGGSKADLAAVVLCASLPRFLGLFLGVWVDRLPARAMLLISGLLRGTMVLGIGWAVVQGQATVLLLSGFAFLNGFLVTLTLSAGNVLVPRLVTEKDLAQGNSLVAGVTQGLPLVGYGLAGLVVKGLGVATTLFWAAPLYFLLVVTALFLRVLEPRRAAPERRPFWSDLLEGWQIRRSSAVLSYTLFFSFMLNVVLNVVNVRAPLFAQLEGTGPGTYALFEGLFSGGALLGIFGVVVLLRRFALEQLVTLGLAVFTLGVLAFTVPQWPLWWAGSGLFGLGVGLLDVAALTLMQRLVPDGLRGRMIGLELSVGALGLSLGAVAAGTALGTGVLMGILALSMVALDLGWVVGSKLWLQKAPS